MINSRSWILGKAMTVHMKPLIDMFNTEIDGTTVQTTFDPETGAVAVTGVTVGRAYAEGEEISVGYDPGNGPFQSALLTHKPRMHHHSPFSPPSQCRHILVQFYALRALRVHIE